MRGRPGRLLTSVVVGGLVVVGTALGTGTASAAETCTYEGTPYSVTAGVVRGTDGACELAPGGGFSTVAAALGLSTGGSTGSGTVTTTTPAPTSLPSVPPVAIPSRHKPRPVIAPAPVVRAAPVPAVGPGVVPAPAPVVAPAPRLAAPAPLAAPAIRAAAPSSGFGAGGFPAASLPGFSTNLFGTPVGSPGAGAPAPFGGIAGALFQPNPAVSTVSETEPLSATTTNGFGTAVTIAAIALACTVGVGVRGVVLGRITRRQLAADVPDDVAAVEEPALVAS